MIGNILGNRYRVLREIGAGGMAKVYLAEDVTGSELVAVKTLYPQFGEDISFVQRFNREAKLASTLTDPHIVRVLDYGADRDLHYLVMEYVEGQDLNDALHEKGRFEWHYALELVDQLATALEHAHAHGVVHRDIKPQNMMLNDKDMLKVLDFGIARVPTLPSLTQSGFIGSPYYASPEQAMGEEVDIRSDIYSSGIVLYEMLSGNIPFDAKSPWSIISQHITSEPPPIELPDDEIPDNVRLLLDKMLAKRSEDRFQNPTMLRQAIAAVLAGQPLPAEDGTAGMALEVDQTALIQSLSERAESAIEAEEWMRAADLLGQAVKLTPADRELAEKLAHIETQARLVSLYRSGKRAFDSKKWEEAINHFNVVLEMSPDYQDASELLIQCHEALKQENTEQFIATRYQEGLSHFENKRWDSAIAAFEEVQGLSPNYEQVADLLIEANKNSNPGMLEQINRTLDDYGGSQVWRWGLVAAGIMLILILFFVAFGNNNRAAGDDANRERLKELYTEAQAALETGNDDSALTLLEQILTEDPDYADVADLRRELVATPMPTVAAATPEIDPLTQLLGQAEEALELTVWDDAINRLTEIRDKDPEFEPARIASLFCDAYVGRGLELLATIESEQGEKAAVTRAKTDFDAGVVECPRRTDLAEQAERAAAYLLALDTAAEDLDTLIKTLTPIVAAEPDYASGYAKQTLYDAYLTRAIQREQVTESIAAALGDYEAALALNVDDPSEAQTRRAELLLSFTQQPAVAQETVIVATPTQASAEASTTPDATADASPTGIKYGRPQLIGPPDDVIFAGSFAEVFLEWEPVGELAEDEYYDLTIMHLFADKPKYDGSLRTRDTKVQIQDVGVGEAGGDRFYWWVTVRKDNTAVLPGGLDNAISPRSEAKTFVWSP